MTPMKHQAESLKFHAKRPIVFDMSDAGTGKTMVQILDFVRQHKKDKLAMMVFAPKSLLRAAWANDIHKFAPHLTVSLCYAGKRQEALNTPADVYVVNHDGVKDLLKLKRAFWKKIGRIVIDESTAFKHHTTARSRAMAKVIANVKCRRLMTGTPNPNGICDLWHQVFLLDGGKRLGKSFFGFRSATCTPEQTGKQANMVKWSDKPGIEPVVTALLKDIVVRHKFEDCVDIPPNHMYSVPVQLAPKHMKGYLELEREAILRNEAGDISAVNKAVLRTKLLQTASGAAYNVGGGYTKIATERYETVMDLVEARAHSIIFYLWQHQLDELVALAKARKITHVVWDSNKPDIEKHFQAGFFQVMFAHPMSAAHGLTLTKGTATIWPSPTDNLEHFAQGFKRVYRIGQKHKTETIVLVAENTVDEVAFENLMGKKARMDDLLKELACRRQTKS